MAILLDASFLIAFFNADDVHHKRAVAIATEIEANKYGLPFTTDHTFDETVSVALRKFGKAKALAFGRHVLDSMLLVNSDKHIFKEAWNSFVTTKLELSFTDCLTVVTLGMTGTEFIATFDKEFKKISSIQVLC